jgi:hypothetical protein
MIIKNYDLFINETVITDEINQNLNNINAIVNNRIKNNSEYYLSETADNKKIIENLSYYTIFTYTGEDNKYKNKPIVCKIKIINKLDFSKIEKKNYPKLEWSYIIEATQDLGKITEEQYTKIKDNYKGLTPGIRGIDLVSDIKNIHILNDNIILNSNEINKVIGKIVYNPEKQNLQTKPNIVNKNIEQKQKDNLNIKKDSNQKTLFDDQNK